MSERKKSWRKLKQPQQRKQDTRHTQSVPWTHDESCVWEPGARRLLYWGHPSTGHPTSWAPQQHLFFKLMPQNTPDIPRPSGCLCRGSETEQDSFWMFFVNLSPQPQSQSARDHMSSWLWGRQVASKVQAWHAAATQVSIEGGLSEGLLSAPCSENSRRHRNFF